MNHVKLLLVSIVVIIDKFADSFTNLVLVFFDKKQERILSFLSLLILLFGLLQLKFSLILFQFLLFVNLSTKTKILQEVVLTSVLSVNLEQADHLIVSLVN